MFGQDDQQNNNQPDSGQITSPTVVPPSSDDVLNGVNEAAGEPEATETAPASEFATGAPSDPQISEPTGSFLSTPAGDDSSSSSSDTTTDETPVASEPTPESTAEESTPEDTTSQSSGASEPAGDLEEIKKEALGQLAPLVQNLDQTPEDKFRTLMMMIQSTDNQDLIKEAYSAAQNISDEQEKAKALLAVVNEIDYFTHHKN